MTELLLFASTGPVNSAIVNLVAPGERATAVALSILGIHLLGDVPSPPLIGAISDATSLQTAFLIAPRRDRCRGRDLALRGAVGRPPRVRGFLRAFFTRALSIFFRKVEVGGASRVPAQGPVIFVANHPNALVDPLLLLCFAPRAASFLAKAPLFSMPFVGFFTRIFAIPIYRQQDSPADLSKNRETFESARKLLSSGGTLALFPEGASHHEPSLLPMKTGAARIALGAAAELGGPLSIVPAGLYYTWKQRFRSSALVLFGDPIAVAPVALDERGDPPRDAVRALTETVAEALGALTLQAATREALDIVSLADRVFSDEDESRPGDLRLTEELARRKQFVDGYRRLAHREPARLARLQEKVERFDADRRAAGLSLRDLTREGMGLRGFARLFAENIGALLLLPVAVAGAVVHWPAYRLAGAFGRRFARTEEDVVSTAKLGFSLLLFPATWLLGSLAAAKLFGPAAGAAALLLLPLSSWAALVFLEALDRTAGRAWASVLAPVQPHRDPKASGQARRDPAGDPRAGGRARRTAASARRIAASGGLAAALTPHEAIRDLPCVIGQPPVVRALVVIRAIRHVHDGGDRCADVLHSVPDAGRHDEKRGPRLSETQLVRPAQGWRALSRVVEHDLHRSPGGEQAVRRALMGVPG